MDFSVVIPIYKRNEIFKKCLISINNQLLKPKEVIIVNNNTDLSDSNQLYNVINSINFVQSINVIIINSPKNSGAIARNIGVKKSSTELIAFLDSDVILEKEYYSTLIKYFLKNSDLIAIQGVDKSFVKSQTNFQHSSLFNKLANYIEEFFETSSLNNRKRAFVSPSLAVSHPNVKKEFEITTEWVSTCAGIFKRKLFERYHFPNQFVTYSNNEYLFLSYSLFLNKEGLMLYTSKAKYIDIQTSKGRLNYIPLIFQIQINDYFIFCRLFKRNFYNIFVFVKSRFGHLIINFLRLFSRNIFSFRNLLFVLLASIYPIIFIRSILKGDLSFYEKHFSNYQ